MGPPVMQGCPKKRNDKRESEPMEPTFVLDETAVYPLLILALASVSYIRSVPYPKLLQAVKDTPRGTKVDWKIPTQTIILDIMQLVLVALGVVLMGRNLFWGARYDRMVVWAYFLLVCVFMAFHLVVNVRGIWKSFGYFGSPKG